METGGGGFRGGPSPAIGFWTNPPLTLPRRSRGRVKFFARALASACSSLTRRPPITTCSQAPAWEHTAPQAPACFSMARRVTDGSRGKRSAPPDPRPAKKTIPTPAGVAAYRFQCAATPAGVGPDRCGGTTGPWVEATHGHPLRPPGSNQPMRGVPTEGLNPRLFPSRSLGTSGDA